MKRTFRFFFAAVVAVMLFALLAVAACGPQGEDPADNTAELILDAGEGTVESDKYDVEVDADLYEFLKDKAPTPPEGLTFAGWYLGDDAIQEGDTMPAGGGTLIAKYYAQYTFEVYLESENGFEKSEENSTTGTAIYGEPFTVKAPSIPHYAQDGDQAETKLKSNALGKNEVGCKLQGFGRVLEARSIPSIRTAARAPSSMTAMRPGMPASKAPSSPSG